MKPDELIKALKAATPEQLIEIRRLLFDIPDDRQGDGVTVTAPRPNKPGGSPNYTFCPAGMTVTHWTQ